MLSRPIMCALLMGASVAVPYGISKAPRVAEQISSKVGEFAGSGDVNPHNPVAVDAAATKLNNDPDSVLFTSQIPLGGIPALHLEEVFRFDITRDWVYMRWPRKSTAPAVDDLFGIRVPLVTGTAVDDVAGSLTYYFNPSGQVQHIAFRGHTGDPRRLVHVLVAQYGLRPQTSPVPGEQLYQALWNGKPQSELRTRPAAVVWSNSPHSTYQVDLALERPGSNRFLRR